MCTVLVCISTNMMQTTNEPLLPPALANPSLNCYVTVEGPLHCYSLDEHFSAGRVNPAGSSSEDYKYMMFIFL